MSDTDSAPDAAQTDNLDTPEVTPLDSETAAAQGDTEPSTYDAEYVAQLKREAVGNRQKAKTMATRLHTELVRANGRLADPNDLPFNPTHLEDPAALDAAIDDLLARKPHFAARTPQGHVGQGTKDQLPPVNLVTHLKSLV